ncbi:hypothetical protein MMC32_008362 [Xylographa parallela]|nr:hypothetical protein [Xylographa parallela]
MSSLHDIITPKQGSSLEASSPKSMFDWILTSVTRYARQSPPKRSSDQSSTYTTISKFASVTEDDDWLKKAQAVEAQRQKEKKDAASEEYISADAPINITFDPWLEIGLVRTVLRPTNEAIDKQFREQSRATTKKNQSDTSRANDYFSSFQAYSNSYSSYAAYTSPNSSRETTPPFSSSYQRTKSAGTSRRQRAPSIISIDSSSNDDKMDESGNDDDMMEGSSDKDEMESGDEADIKATGFKTYTSMGK